MKKYPELDALLLRERDLLRAVDEVRGKIKDFKMKHGVALFE